MTEPTTTTPAPEEEFSIVLPPKLYDFYRTFAARDDTRPILNTIHIRLPEGLAFAADGFQAAIMPLEINGTPPEGIASINLPGQIIERIKRMTTGVKTKVPNLLTPTEREDIWQVSGMDVAGPYTFNFHPTVGMFPDIMQWFPGHHEMRDASLFTISLNPQMLNKIAQLQKKLHNPYALTLSVPSEQREHPGYGKGRPANVRPVAITNQEFQAWLMPMVIGGGGLDHPLAIAEDRSRALLRFEETIGAWIDEDGDAATIQAAATVLNWAHARLDPDMETLRAKRRD